ncbi:MAG: YbeD family protein [Nevskiales bacterium]
MTSESLLEFPCEFPIKAFGRADKGAQAFVDLVFELVAQHVEGLTTEQISLNASSGGRFIAVTVNITATSQAQLDNIYQSLTDHDQVVMSL